MPDENDTLKSMDAAIGFVPMSKKPDPAPPPPKAFPEGALRSGPGEAPKIPHDISRCGEELITPRVIPGPFYVDPRVLDIPQEFWEACKRLMEKSAPTADETGA